MTQYVGILDGNGKTYGVRIPDLPGCYGAGRSPEAALSDAMSAAREWLAHRMTSGEKDGSGTRRHEFMAGLVIVLGLAVTQDHPAVRYPGERHGRPTQFARRS